MASRRAKRARRAANKARGGAKLTKKQDRARRGRSGDRSGGSIPVQSASISGIKGLIARGIARSSLGQKAANIARQQISRLPGFGRFGARGARARPAVEILGPSGTAIATRPAPYGVVRRAAGTAVKVGLGGAAFEAGSTLFGQFSPGGDQLARAFRGGGGSRRTRGQGVPFSPGTVVPTDSITHSWVANGVPFAQLADGRVMVRRKNGTIKTFRRPRPIVLGRNPGVRDLVRADKKIDALLKLVKKRFPARRTAAPRHSATHN